MWTRILIIPIMCALNGCDPAGGFDLVFRVADAETGDSVSGASVQGEFCPEISSCTNNFKSFGATDANGRFVASFFFFPSTANCNNSTAPGAWIFQIQKADVSERVELIVAESDADPISATDSVGSQVVGDAFAIEIVECVNTALAPLP